MSFSLQLVYGSSEPIQDAPESNTTQLQAGITKLYINTIITTKLEGFK